MRFSERTLSETLLDQSPSQSAIFLSELRVLLPLIVLPLKLLQFKTSKILK